jgi:hypothetical protein
MGSKVNKIMNKVSDKLVPKELAPFLPIASAFLPGIGGGIMSQYLMPQLLTALSSAKMTGEVDPKAQAITGIMSALQGNVKQTKAEAALLEKNPELAKQIEKANKLSDATKITDTARLEELANANQIEGLNIFQGGDVLGSGIGDAGAKPFGGFFDDFLGGPFQPGDAMGPKEILSFTDDAGNSRFFRPDSDALTSFLNTETTTPLDLSKLTGQSFKDAVVSGGDITAAGFDKKIKALQGMEGIGKQQGLQALNKARNFMNTDIGFNKATALKAGLGATPYLMNQADIAARKIEEENAAADAANQSYRDASSALSNFFVNRKPNYDMLYGYNQGGRIGLNMGGMGSIPQTPMVPQGMQLEGRGGGFIPMGAQEKKDDVPAMLAKNEFVMTSDAVRAAGGGSIEKGAQKMYDLMNSLEAQV